MKPTPPATAGAGAERAGVACRERVVEMAGAQGPVFGVLAEPGDTAPGAARVAVLIVAGQPQTRVGSHRMFTDLARLLAAAGLTSLRFDVGGWGDSPGEALPFEASDRDVAVAAAWLAGETGASEGRAADLGEGSGTPIRLWVLGLCDGASAAVLALPALRAANCEPQALVLINPWVRSEASLSDAMVRNYYAKRLFEREFWARLLTGKVPLANLLREPLEHLAARLRGSRAASTAGERNEAQAPATEAAGAVDAASFGASTSGAVADLPSLLMAQLERYPGRVLTVLSGNDLTAGETESLLSRDRRWRRRLEREGEILRVPGADHTFSVPAQWAAVARWLADRATDS